MLLYPSVVVPATAITAGNALIDSTTANAFAAPIVSGSPYDFGPYRDGRSYLELYASGVLVAKALISKSKSAGVSLGTEKLTNPSFDVDISGWNNNRCSVSSVAGGYLNNCCQMTKTDSTSQYIAQQNTTVIGELDVFSAWVKSGTSGNEACYFMLFDKYPSGNIVARNNQVSSGTWTQYSVYATQNTITGAPHLYKASDTPGTMLFDEASHKKVLTPASTAALLESAPGVRGWIYKSATAFENSALTMKIIQIKRYPNPRKINGVSTHHA